MIPEQAIKLMRFSGYLEMFREMEDYYNTEREAYDAVEREYQHYFGENKYSSFDSFRRMLYRHRKQQLFKVESF